MRELTFTRDDMEVPCDCQAGQCDWVHRAAVPGSERHYVNGTEVTKDEWEEEYRRGMAS